MTDFKQIQELSIAGRHLKCLKACEDLLRINPKETCAYKYAGKALLALGQLEQAKQYLIKAHQLDSNDPETIKDIGNVSLENGDKDTAIQWYEKSLKVSKECAQTINSLANLKKQSGNTQEAIDLFKRAIVADPSLSEAYKGAAASLLALGDLNQARLC